jgi:hypothetical protein
MQPVLEGVELLVAVAAEDDQLPVEDVAALGEVDLGEVPAERLGAARLEIDLVAVDEGEGTEAVVLGLVDPVLTLRKLLSREGELRLDRWLQGECDGAIVLIRGRPQA